MSLRPSRLGDFCGFSGSLLLFCVSVPIWSRPISQLRLRPRALLRCWLPRLFALPRSRKWVNWLLAGTASYGGERHVVECLGPEPGGGHGFRFRGASEHNTTHTYNSTLDSHSPGNEAATPNFYFSASIT